MKAIAISDISGGSAWSSDHSWHYSTKQNQNLFHPVNLPSEEQYASKPSRVSRSLFGPSDPTESRRLEFEEFNSQRFSERSKWNFDFYQEKPMSGRFDWRKVCNSGSSTKQSSDKGCESLWANKSPKKYSSGQDSLMDLKRTNRSWTSMDNNSTVIAQSRSPDFKKKVY